MGGKNRNKIQHIQIEYQKWCSILRDINKRDLNVSFQVVQYNQPVRKAITLLRDKVYHSVCIGGLRNQVLFLVVTRRYQELKMRKRKSANITDVVDPLFRMKT